MRKISVLVHFKCLQGLQKTGPGSLIPGMAYRIEYFSNGVLVGAVPCPKSLIDARLNARRGLKLHKAEFAKIVDMDARGVVVEIIKPDA